MRNAPWLSDRELRDDWKKPRRSYRGSPLERWHAEQREVREANAAIVASLPKPSPADAAKLAAERQLARAALVRHHAAKRRCAILQRTPAWADLKAIRAVYLEAQRLTAQTGMPHHVDHDIPLQGELVSGLHVANNLAILTASANSRKRNVFHVEP